MSCLIRIRRFYQAIDQGCKIIYRLPVVFQIAPWSVQTGLILSTRLIPVNHLHGMIIMQNFIHIYREIEA